MIFGNVLTAMVTPFDENLEVNYDAAAKLAKYLAENGSDGIVVAGTTGETPTLSKDEKVKLFKVVKEAVGDSCKVVAGIGTNSTKASIDLVKEVADFDLDGIMAVVPYYNKPSQEGLYAHFKAIAEATDLPVMLYNIPGRTGVNMVPQTVEKLSGISNIVSIKEAAGSMDQVSELKSILPPYFSIYAGDDSLTLPMLSLGCNGIISVASHVIGPSIKKMVDAWYNSDTDKALKWHLTLLPIFKGMFVTSNPVPVKYVMNELGINVGQFRLPLVEPTEKDKTVLNNLLERIKNLPEDI